MAGRHISIFGDQEDIVQQAAEPTSGKEQSKSEPHVLVTGGAGFIGSHLVDRLMAEGWRVTIVDSMDPFYPRWMKEANIAPHRTDPRFRFLEADILDPRTWSLAEDPAHPFNLVVHLAAKAGVRPSLADPAAYHGVNVSGTLSVLEACRRWRVPHVLIASSSSVYGEDPAVPWREDACKEEPISPYALTKVMAERCARRWYAEQQGALVSVLRFFTVYGPRQRPDLAIHGFARSIDQGLPVTQYGDGTTRRDYTYVSDIVDGIMGAVHREQGGGFEVYNLGNSRTVELRELIATLERVMERTAIIARRPEQQGDVPQTYADISKAGRQLGYAPKMSLEEGLTRFVEWYREGPGRVAR